MLIEWLTLAAVLATILATLVYTLITGISPVPSSPRATRALLALAEAGLPAAREDLLIVDLGAGFGTLMAAFAKRFPEARVLGIELSPLPWLVCRLRLLLRPRPKVTLRRGDFHRMPLGEATLVLCYLYPGGMTKLRPKLEAELRAGSLVVSHAFAMPGWTPERVMRVTDPYATPVYLYRVPARSDDPAPEPAPPLFGAAPFPPS